MRKIKFSRDEKFDEISVLRSLIENADPAKPYTIPAIRMALRVTDKIADEHLGETNTVLFEEDEYLFVRGRVEEAAWMRATAGILAFIDKIIDARVMPAATAPAQAA